MILWTDLETFSSVKLPKTGSYKYAESDDFEIMLWAYALDGGPVKVWDLTKDKEMPDDLKEYVKKATIIGMHNSMFDRICIERSPYAWVLEGKKILDTMVKAYLHSLPGGLKILCEVFNLSEDVSKKKEGQKLIHLFCKPQPVNRKIKRATRKTHPAEWKKFIEYARFDIISVRILNRKMPSWNMISSEYQMWLLDQKINDKGFYVDQDLAVHAISEIKKDKNKKDQVIWRKTDGAVNSATQRDKLLKHILEAYDVTLPDMQKSTLERRLQDPNLPEGVREIIKIRLETSGTATTKYNTVLISVCKDGRLHGTLQFGAAFRTLRWGGRIFQPQNLPRPTLKNDDIELGIYALKHDITEFVFESVKEIASSALRGVIIAELGNKLVVSDLSAIEGRTLAWLAGEQWKVDVYRKYDNKELLYDMYVLTYANTFGVPPEEVTSYERQLGKVLELALGYGGGVASFISFAVVYGIDLEELAEKDIALEKWAVQDAERWYDMAVERNLTCGLSKETFIFLDAIKRMWRNTNSAIWNFWGDIEDAWKEVLLPPSPSQMSVKGIVVDRQGSWLRMKLPSGRYLSYPGAKYKDGELTYLGLDTFTKKWCRLKTWGGKITENLVQAIARDVLADGMKRVDAAGYDIVLTVHDEVVTEVPDENRYNVEQLNKLLATNSPWNHGLPLAAEGFESYRYRKD